MFLLKHTFDNDYKIPQKETNNLMDYAKNATHIAKWQWDLIHDPGIIIRVFERDKDGMKWGFPLKDDEFFIKHGIINYQSRSYAFPAMQKIMSTQTGMNFFNRFPTPKVNDLKQIVLGEWNPFISHLVIQPGPTQIAAIGIGYVADFVRNETIIEPRLESYGSEYITTNLPK